MEGFRKWRLQGPRVEASPGEPCSLGEAVMSLVAEGRIRQLFVTMGHSERDGIDSMSSGGMSLDLGEMWRQGSPQREGELELGSDDENDDSYVAGDSDDNVGPKDYISEVSESSL